MVEGEKPKKREPLLEEVTISKDDLLKPFRIWGTLSLIPAILLAIWGFSITGNSLSTLREHHSMSEAKKALVRDYTKREEEGVTLTDLVRRHVIYGAVKNITPRASSLDGKVAMTLTDGESDLDFSIDPNYINIEKRITPTSREAIMYMLQQTQIGDEVKIIIPSLYYWNSNEIQFIDDYSNLSWERRVEMKSEKAR